MIFVCSILNDSLFLLLGLLSNLFSRRSFSPKHEGSNKDQEGGHENKDRQIEGVCLREVPGEGIVTPLNHGRLLCLVYKGQPVAFIINFERENAETLWHSKL